MLIWKLQNVLLLFLRCWNERGLAECVRHFSEFSDQLCCKQNTFSTSRHNPLSENLQNWQRSRNLCSPETDLPCFHCQTCPDSNGENVIGWQYRGEKKLDLLKLWGWLVMGERCANQRIYINWNVHTKLFLKRGGFNACRRWKQQWTIKKEEPRLQSWITLSQESLCSLWKFNLHCCEKCWVIGLATPQTQERRIASWNINTKNLLSGQISFSKVYSFALRWMMNAWFELRGGIYCNQGPVLSTTVGWVTVTI